MVALAEADESGTREPNQCRVEWNHLDTRASDQLAELLSGVPPALRPGQHE